MWLGWIHKASVMEETGLCITALLHCVCRICERVSFSHGIGGAKLSISRLPPCLVVLKRVFSLWKTAWLCSSFAGTKAMLVGGRKQLEGVIPLTH